MATLCFTNQLYNSRISSTISASYNRSRLERRMQWRSLAMSERRTRRSGLTSRELEVGLEICVHRSTTANDRPRIVTIGCVYSDGYAASAAHTRVPIDIPAGSGCRVLWAQARGTQGQQYCGGDGCVVRHGFHSDCSKRTHCVNGGRGNSFLRRSAKLRALRAKSDHSGPTRRRTDGAGRFLIFSVACENAGR
jgi:hypothetical protein